MNKSKILGLLAKNKILKSKKSLKCMILILKAHQNTKNKKKRALLLGKVNVIKSAKNILSNLKKRISLSLQIQTLKSQKVNSIIILIHLSKIMNTRATSSTRGEAQSLLQCQNIKTLGLKTITILNMMKMRP
jgi:hypothetical protein